MVSALVDGCTDGDLRRAIQQIALFISAARDSLEQLRLVHAARAAIGATSDIMFSTVMRLAKANPHVPKCAALLAAFSVHCIVYHCTINSVPVRTRHSFELLQ